MKMLVWVGTIGALVAIAAVLRWATTEDAPLAAVLNIGTPAPPFTLSVTAGLDRLQITNDTEASWDGCRVTISDRYMAPFALTPHQTAAVLYESFKDDDRPIPPNEGYARAHDGVTIQCLGPDYEQHRAAFTFNRERP